MNYLVSTGVLICVAAAASALDVPSIDECYVPSTSTENCCESPVPGLWVGCPSGYPQRRCDWVTLTTGVNGEWDVAGNGQSGLWGDAIDETAAHCIVQPKKCDLLSPTGCINDGAAYVYLECFIYQESDESENNPGIYDCTGGIQN